MRDLRNQRFGRLVALEPTYKRQNGRIVWKCQCDCGNISYVTVNHLLDGGTKSCGCLRESLLMKDISGQRFGLLTAIRPTNERCGHFVVWECRCDCGNTKLVAGSNLRRGLVRSCGCLRKQPRKRKCSDLEMRSQQNLF